MAPQNPKHYLVAPMENHQLLPKAPWAAQKAWQGDSHPPHPGAGRILPCPAVSAWGWTRALEHLMLSKPGEGEQDSSPLSGRWGHSPWGVEWKIWSTVLLSPLQFGEPRKGWALQPWRHSGSLQTQHALLGYGDCWAALSPTGGDSVLTQFFWFHFQTSLIFIFKWFIPCFASGSPPTTSSRTNSDELHRGTFKGIFSDMLEELQCCESSCPCTGLMKGSGPTLEGLLGYL